jgi:hypothetical protein
MALDWNRISPILMALGGGIASGGAPGGGGWAGGIGRGLALAQDAVQQSQADEFKRMLLAIQMQSALKPDIKDITLPGGGKVSASVSPSGAVSPLDTSAFGAGTVVPDFKDTQALRKEYQATPQYQTFVQAQPIYKSMQEASKRNTRASDLNLVYGLAKIFDPNSVVREGEMVLVKDTSSIPDWLTGEINRLNGGASLQPGTRSAIMQEAQSRFGAYQKALRPVFDRYSGIASRYNMPASDFSTEFENLAPVAAPTQAPAIRTPTPPNAEMIYRNAQGKRIRFNMQTQAWEALN